MKEEFSRKSAGQGTVLVVGATGFLGPVLVEEILKSGRKVVAGVRDIERAKKQLPFPRVKFVKIDMNEDLSSDVWEKRLKEHNVSGVVNNAAIAVAPKGQSIENVNTKAPLALFQAIKKLDIEAQSKDKTAKKIRLVHISTTGVNWDDAKDFEYSRTKKKTSDALAKEKELDWVTVSPNIIYEPGRGHLRLESIASLPIIPVVGRNDVQPIYSREIGIGVARLLAPESKAQHVILEATGPEVMNWGKIFSDTRYAMGKRIAVTPRLSLKFAQAVTSITHNIIPSCIRTKLGPLDKMTPDTINMMTKGAVMDNSEWIKHTGVRPICLYDAYTEYSKGKAEYEKFLDALRKEEYKGSAHIIPKVEKGKKKAKKNKNLDPKS